MNLEEWERKNGRVVRKIELFYDEYQKENSIKFEDDWVKANKEMCKKASKIFKNEIMNQIDEISVIQ